MGLELYLDLLSQPCRAVYIFAKKIGVPFELRLVELLKGQHCSEDFAKVTPLRKVPVLKDGDFTLAESVAILLYLSRKYEAPDHWYPEDLQACARVDEYLAWQHTSLRSSCSMVLWQKMMLPVFLGESVSPEALASTMAELNRCLQLLEDKFLKEDDFLTGPSISVADLVAVTELMHPVSAGCHVFKTHPKLDAWRQRVEAAVGEDLFQEAHEVVLKAKDLPPVDNAIKDKLKPLAQVLLYGGSGDRPPGRSLSLRRRRAHVPARHALRGAGHQPARRPRARGAGEAALRRRRRHPGQARGPRERDGAARPGHGGGRLGRALRAADGLLHRSGGHGGAEPGPQRPLLRGPRQGAAAGPGPDTYPLFPPGALADRQERDGYDVFVIGAESAPGRRGAGHPFRGGLPAGGGPGGHQLAAPPPAAMPVTSQSSPPPSSCQIKEESFVFQTWPPFLTTALGSSVHPERRVGLCGGVVPAFRVAVLGRIVRRLLRSEDGTRPVWLSGQSVGLKTEGSQVRFRSRAHAWLPEAADQ